MTSQGLDFILAGMKNCEELQELNLGNCMLTDDDLAKICQRLREQDRSGLERLKLHANDFKEPWPFIELLQDCGDRLTHLDFSKMSFQVPQAVTQLATNGI